jgi:hypothetical protein
MFIDLKQCTVTPPVDCAIPVDRLSRIPVGRSESEKPTILTERILRHQLSVRFCEIRDLEVEGPIPKNPEKVKELHHFAVNFRKQLPPFFRTLKPDTKWDLELLFVPAQREMLSYLIDCFLMALHRPYVFTREESQRQVYNSSLAILDSQDRLFEILGSLQTPWSIATTFPTFDAAVLLAVVLVSNPERYHTSFQRPYQSLKNAYQRLRSIGPVLPLANTGADILQTTMRRIIEAQERAGFTINTLSADIAGCRTTTSPHQANLHSMSNSSSGASPDLGPWHFEPDQTAMNWAAQDPNFADFDFSNLDVPIPLKELFWDEQMATEVGFEPMWTAPLSEQQGWIDVQPGAPQATMDTGENSLWDFLSGYSNADEVSNVQ